MDLSPIEQRLAAAGLGDNPDVKHLVKVLRHARKEPGVQSALLRPKLNPTFSSGRSNVSRRTWHRNMAPLLIGKATGSPMTDYYNGEQVMR